MKKYLILISIFILQLIPSMGRSQNVGHYIYEVQSFHSFSSLQLNDLFKLTLWGDNIFDGIITFNITSSSGEYLYFEQFTVGELMDFGPPETDLAFERSKEDSSTIIIIMHQFLDERSFRYPAIADSSEMKSNYTDFVTWSIIWNEKTPIGFRYLLGSEDGRMIAYSTKHRKVIVYYTCC